VNIWVDNQVLPNDRVYFRKKFVYNGGLLTAVKIATDGKYWLWLNNELIAAEGGLNRGPAPADGYYDEIDLSDKLIFGENILAVSCWYWGNGGRNNVTSGQPGLWVAGITKSDENFTCLRPVAFQPAGKPDPSYLYGGHNTRYDARGGISGWQEAGFDDSGWTRAIAVDDTPWGKMIRRPIPMFRFTELRDYVKLETGIKNGAKTVTAVLPYAAWIFPGLSVTASGGELIEIHTDRLIVNGGPGEESDTYFSQRCEYAAKAGSQAFEFEHGLYGEKVIYTMPSNVKVNGFFYRETGYDCGFDGSFVCGDPDLNVLYEKCVRTLYICMRDNFMDCPDRERGQWIGDASTQVPQVFYCLSAESRSLVKKMIKEFVDWKDGDILRGLVPGEHCLEIPGQSLNAISSVGMIAEYYKNTGEKDVLDYAVDAAEKYLLLWETDGDGLVIARKGGYLWHDHGKNVDIRILENCWYTLAIDFVLGIRENQKLRERKASIAENFNRVFWKGGKYSDRFIDDRANAMAVLAGFTDKEKNVGVIEVLKTVMNASPYMEGYVLESLFRMGCRAEAMERIKKRYLPLIKNENSTLWEDFHSLGTRNHAWTGAPLTLLCKWVVGFTPVKPGYDEFLLAPDPGGLKIEAAIPTVKGKVTIKTDNLSLRMEKPANMKGTIIFNGIRREVEESETAVFVQ